MKLKWLFLLCWLSTQIAFADTVAPIRSMPPHHVVVGHNSWVNSVTFSPDGRYALSGSSDETLKLW